MRPDPARDLRTILDFTEEDLAANRAGRLSQAQRQLLLEEIEKKRAERLLGIVELGGLIAGLAVLLVLLGDSPELALIVVMATGLLLIFYEVLNTVKIRQMAADAESDAVAVSEGRLKLTGRQGRYGVTRYRLGIEGDPYWNYVSESVYRALEEGCCYRVYYSPVSRDILSLEKTK